MSAPSLHPATDKTFAGPTLENVRLRRIRLASALKRLGTGSPSRLDYHPVPGYPNNDAA